MSEYDELPEIFDPSTHEGTRDLDVIPAGWYSAQIIESSVKDARNGNGSYLLAVFQILSGEHAGRQIYQNVTLQNASQQAVEIGQRLLTDIYTAIGITTPTKEINVLNFKPVMARVGIKRDKDGIYPDRNIVGSVRPPDYQPKRARNTPPTPTSLPWETPKPTPSNPPTSNSAAPRGDTPWR
jgi:hypothetical protein